MKKTVILILSFAAICSGCRSLEITNFEVLNNKDGKIIYRVDALESGVFSSRPVLGLICVADSKGDLTCR
ncbi:MAG: hypothetical protein J0L53_02225 [Spirochaetes bacterium]|nr:hypothetical protein [Spirochaetota bacterium]MBX3720341.1 hypothetical protein [Turneriella sp.]